MMANFIIMIMYFITGWFVIDATKLIILIFLGDFVSIAIAADNARAAQYPMK